MLPIRDLWNPEPDHSQDQQTFDYNMAKWVKSLRPWGDDVKAALGENEAQLLTVLSQVAADNSASIAQAVAAADEAVDARDSAIAAWAASMAPAETLPAISQSLHHGALVACLRRSVGKSSDPTWIERCSHTSWENDDLCSGAWRRQQVNEAACRAVSGAGTGDFYQNTTDGKFYMLNAGSGQTEVWRGNKQKFPAEYAVAFEVNRWVIYDLTDPTCPMWMVFVEGISRTTQTFIGHSGITCADAIDDKIYFGVDSGTSSRSGVREVSFLRDDCNVYGESREEPYIGKHNANISQRNALTSLSSNGVHIVNKNVKDIAATILPDAPADAATGLPVPTVAVATAGGVSVIRHDGAVANITATDGNNAVQKVALDCNELYFITSTHDSWGSNAIPTSTVRFGGIYQFFRKRYYYTDAVASPVNLGSMAGAAGAALVKNAIGTPSGLSIYKPNLLDGTKGMVAYITKDYNTGWMPGDIRGAWLVDTVAETITGSGNLVSNGAFTSNITGWTDGFFATGSHDSGTLKVTCNGGGDPIVYQDIATVVGREYMLVFTVTATNSSAGVSIGSVGEVAPSAWLVGNLAAGTYMRQFKATATTTRLMLGVYDTTAATYASFDAVSVQLAEPDRSVKNRGLIVNGTLTKSAVASGAQLVAYSGFGGSNYLEQLYNSDLDFGTGDFSLMGWAIAVGGDQSIVYRNDSLVASPPHGINVWCYGGYIKVVVAGAYVDYFIPISVWFHFAIKRASGVLYLYVNGALVSQVSSGDSLTCSAAFLRIGSGYYAGGISNLAKFKISATAPSSADIAKIYRDELQLFQAGAQCTLAGTSNAVVDLDHDDFTDLTRASTASYTSAFKGLLRVSATASAVGTITSVSSSYGSVVTAGSSGAYWSQPAITLREQLGRSQRRGGHLPVIEVITASQTYRAKRTGYHKITLIGGGASAGTNWSYKVPGGSMGGVVIAWVWLTAGVDYTIVIGAAGTAVVSMGASGVSGGTSTFSGPDISTLTATGATGVNSTGTPGAPGVGSGGTFNVKGNSGTPPFAETYGSGFVVPGLAGISQYDYGSGGVAPNLGAASTAAKPGVCIIES